MLLSIKCIKSISFYYFKKIFYLMGQKFMWNKNSLFIIRIGVQLYNVLTVKFANRELFKVLWGIECYV